MTEEVNTAEPEEEPIIETEAAQEESSSESQPERKIYDLHIKVPIEMKETLRDAAELAYMIEDIPKADLVDLMNLFIGWGMAVLKQKWLDRVGYQ